MSTTVKKVLCAGLTGAMGLNGTAGLVEASEGFYFCFQSRSAEVSPCVPAQHGPVESPHLDRTMMGSTSVAAVWAFPEFPAAVVVERALPNGDQTEIHASSSIIFQRSTR